MELKECECVVSMLLSESNRVNVKSTLKTSVPPHLIKTRVTTTRIAFFFFFCISDEPHCQSHLCLNRTQYSHHKRDAAKSKKKKKKKHHLFF